MNMNVLGFLHFHLWNGLWSVPNTQLPWRNFISEIPRERLRSDTQKGSVLSRRHCWQRQCFLCLHLRLRGISDLHYLVQGHYHNCSIQRKGWLKSTISSFNTSNARLGGLEYKFTPERSPDSQERKAGRLSFLAECWESGKINMFRSRCGRELDTSSSPLPTPLCLEVDLDGWHHSACWST